LENLSVDEDINSVWENIKDTSKPQLQSVWFCTKLRSINCGLMKNVYILSSKEAG